jgi:hypothetical protein
MLRFGKLPPKTRFLIACILVLAVTPFVAPWFGFHGDDRPNPYLDAVAEGFRKDPRLSVISVDREAGQIVLLVRQGSALLTFTASKVDGPGPLEEWKYTWKNKAGGTVAVGNTRGMPGKTIQVPVPGLP